MLKIFRKNKNEPAVKFADLNGLPLHEGDMVMSLRYDLGKCIIRRTSEGLVYESVENGKQVSWSRMIDASSKNQKVLKVE